MTDMRASQPPAATGAPSQRDSSNLPSDPRTTDLTTPPAAGEQDPTSQANSDDIRDPEKRRLSQEAAETRRKLRETEKRLAEYEAERAKAEEAKLSETERLQKKVSDLEAQHDERTRAYQERLVKAEIKAAAAGYSVVDPDAVVKLLDWAELEYDESGVPSNIDKLLDKLLKAKPYLLAASSGTGRPPVSSGGPVNPSRSSAAPGTELTDALIARMTPAEYEARRPEIQAYLFNKFNRR